MPSAEDQIYEWDGHLYIPFRTARLAAGPFLPLSLDSTEQHLMLPREFHYGARDRLLGGVLRPQRGLAAARIHGDSMICRDIFDGDIVLFQRSAFERLDNDRIVVIEKVGEEEGYGAWALKKFVIERPRSYHQDEYADERDWDDQILVLRSYNPRVSAWSLDPSGRYRLHGVFKRSIPSHEARLIDSDEVRRMVTGKE